jgi:alkylation response protein AidB-like acyl-CoA dehydrogenase
VPVPVAATEDQLALQASIRDWAKRAAPLEAVRGLEPGRGAAQPSAAQPSTGQPSTGQPSTGQPSTGQPSTGQRRSRREPPGGSERCWRELAGLGVFGIALPAAVGGDGGTVADLAAALEQLTLPLVPGPVLPTLLAGLVAAPLAGGPAGNTLLPALAAGEQPAAVALDPGSLTAVWQDDGSLRVTGETGLVLGAGDGTAVLAGAAVTGTAPDQTAVDGAAAGPAVAGVVAAAGATGAGGAEVWFWIPVGHPGVTVTSRVPADFSRPLAGVRLDGAVIAPGLLLPGVTRDRVRDLAAVLFAVEAAAVAAWCTQTAASYARTRSQFGRPIGAFQAVKHLCAGLLCRAEQAAAVAWDAARAADDAPDELPLAAAAAAAIALDAAVDNAKDCIQVLGGIGFTWEHDAHLYLRRALALRQLLSGSAGWRVRTARLALAGARRRVALSTSTGATSTGATSTGATSTGPVAEAARAVAAAVAAVPRPDRRDALAAAGYVAPQWPPPYGLGATAGDVLVIDEELARAGLSRPDLVIGGWAGLAVVRYGSAGQRDRFLGPTLRGEITWCQLFSEPEAGSDLAAVATRAERVPAGQDGPAGWRLTGQKVWTSLAHEAGWAICLARTDPAAPKHRGITFFLVDMRSPGIGIRPLREITGRAMFNEVFLDGVFVPDDCVLGECGEGWRIARTALAAERVAMAQGPALGEAAEGLIAVIQAAGRPDDPAVLEQAGALIADGLAGTLLDLRSALAQLSGTDAGPLAAVRKLHGVAHRQAVAEAVLALCGPDGAAADGAAADAVHEFLLTRCLSIAGGTTQILLSVVAQRVLGLPREEAR